MWGHACFLKNHSLLIFDSNNFLTSSSTSTFFLLLGDALWRCFPFFKFDFLKFYFLYFYLVHSFVCLFLPSLPPLSLFLSFFQNFCFIAETVFHVELFLSTLMSFSFFFPVFSLYSGSNSSACWDLFSGQWSFLPETFWNCHLKCSLF